MTDYLAKIETRVAGIPCLLGVTFYYVQQPSRYADNPYDFDGYIECDYEILDRNGRVAPWLERKVTARDDARLVKEIDSFFEHSYEY